MNEFKTMSDEAIEMIANRFKILSEPVRLRILQTLEEGRLSVSDLATAAATTQPNVSKHLKMMQAAGLVSKKQEGNSVYYFISDDSVFHLCDAVCRSLKEKLEEQSAIFA